METSKRNLRLLLFCASCFLLSVFFLLLISISYPFPLPFLSHQCTSTTFQFSKIFSPTMARAKTTHTMVKLVSAAKTGYEKWFNIPRSTQKLNLILYDPVAKRHCLFTEDKKRRVPEVVPKDYNRKHRV